MEKIVLSEQLLFFGNIKMPKGFEINKDELSKNILESKIQNKEFFCKSFDKLNTYIKEFINVKFNISIVNKKKWGNAYKPKTLTPPLIEVDPVDLKNSPDFTMLYGVNVEKCFVKIFYDDNRRKGRSWDIELTNNKFIMFPSTNIYIISNEQQDHLNFVQTITYEFN